MTHLSRDERLLALDGVLDATRQAHLTGCIACRTEVESLRGVLDRVRAIDVPEPSPLFWDHLAARVGDAIAREPLPAAARGWWSPRLAWAATAVVVTAAGAGYLTRPAAPAPPVAAHAVPVAPPAPADDGGRAIVESDDASTDDGWAILAALAEDADPDETFAPAVGQAELSISTLSADERRALAGELTAALAPGGAREG
jgi:hypothetical protein